MRIKPIANEHRVYSLNDTVLLAVFEEGGVLFDSKSRRCLEINSSGAHMLNFLDGRMNIEDVVHAVSARFREPEDRVRKDLDLFLKELIGKGWVNVR